MIGDRCDLFLQSLRRARQGFGRRFSLTDFTAGIGIQCKTVNHRQQRDNADDHKRQLEIDQWDALCGLRRQHFRQSQCQRTDGNTQPAAHLLRHIKQRIGAVHLRLWHFGKRQRVERGELHGARQSTDEQQPQNQPGRRLRRQQRAGVALIGANGAGKSTLLMSIFGQPRISGGQILFRGEDISQRSTHYVASSGIAQAPEGRRIFPDMSVEENLLMGTITVGNRYVDEDLLRMFELFPRLKERRNQRAMTMSGGEQQMLAIARALMSRPKLLLLDEPSLGLAPIIVKQIFSILRELTQDGMTLFLVEQNANHALKLSDRGYVMVNGQIRLTGSGAELLSNQEVRKAYLGGA